jgi:hypothetical protein
MSAISAGTAAFIDYCPACGNGTAPWLVAAAVRGRLSRKGNVAGISQPFAASFLSPSTGWVVGALRTGSVVTFRIVRTDDGGQTWQVQYPAG